MVLQIAKKGNSLNYLFGLQIVIKKNLIVS